MAVPRCAAYIAHIGVGVWYAIGILSVAMVVVLVLVRLRVGSYDG